MIISVLLLSILPYVLYFFIADSISAFSIYKTATILLSSYQFYLSVLLLFGISIVVDLFHILLVKELKTPLHILFDSISHDDELSYKEKKTQFKKIAEALKKGEIEL